MNKLAALLSAATLLTAAPAFAGSVVSIHAHLDGLGLHYSEPVRYSDHGHYREVRHVEYRREYYPSSYYYAEPVIIVRDRHHGYRDHGHRGRGHGHRHHAMRHHHGRHCRH